MIIIDDWENYKTTDRSEQIKLYFSIKIFNKHSILSCIDFIINYINIIINIIFSTIF